MDPKPVEASQAGQPHDETGDEVSPAGSLRPPLSGPGWYVNGWLLIGLLLIVWSASSPGGSFSALWAWLLVPVLFLSWLVRFIWKLVRDRRQLGDLSRWFIVPAMVAVVIVVLTLDLPLRARFAVSRSAFDEVVAAAPPSEDSDFSPPLSIGLYRFTSVYRDGDAIIFERTDFHDWGFAYLPHGPSGIAPVWPRRGSSGWSVPSA